MSYLATDEIASKPAAPPRASLDESVTVPEKSRVEWGIALLLFAASCLYLRFFYNYTHLFSDEGIILQEAQRILGGDVPYRDFFSLVTPGSFYWMALLFKVLGSSILVARGALVAYGGAFSVFTYLLARRVCCRWNAVFAAVPAVIVCLPSQFVWVHNWDSTLWACFALYAAVRLLEKPHWGWAFALGSLAAVTCLFEQSKGAGLVLGLAAGFLVVAMSGGTGVWAGWRGLAALVLGFAWPVLLTLAYFADHRALAPLAADLLWPFRHYSGPERLSYGEVFGWRGLPLFMVSPFFILCALPIFAVCALAWSAFQLQKKRRATGACRYYVLVSGALSGLLLSTIATSRPDSYHIFFQAPLFCLVLGWMAEAARTPLLRSAKVLGVSYVIASFAALGLALLCAPLGAKYSLETRRGVLRASALYDDFQYVQSRLSPGERILVYPYQPLYYYLTATYSVSRYDWLVPAMSDPSQLQEIIRELEASRARFVLLDPSYVEDFPAGYPNLSLQTLASKDPVEDYILSRYRPCRTGPRLVFMVRKGIECPRG